MPLVAQVDGERTVSLALGAQEWTALKAALRARNATVLLSCGLSGHPKTSRLGTQFFAHDPGVGCGAHGPESAEHLMAKQQIVQAARVAGWSAEPEVAGDGWVADVLAERGAARVAFEVQWSRQSAEEYRARQRRYDDAGIRGAWFVRHKVSVPTPPDQALPAFVLEADGNAMAVIVGPVRMPLGEAVTRLLTRRIGFRAHVSTGEPSTVPVAYHRTSCHRSSRPYLVWEVGDETITGACGTSLIWPEAAPMCSLDRPEASHAVLMAGRQVTVDTGIPLARLQRTHTGQGGRTYTAFRCPHCGYPFGDFFLAEWLRERWSDEEYRPIATVEVAGSQRVLPHPHWCVDRGSGLCAAPPPETTPAWESTEGTAGGVEPSVEVALVGDRPGLPSRGRLAVRGGPSG